MPFDSKSAIEPVKRSKRGPVKKELPSIKEKMEMLYEKVLDDLLINQDKLTKTERVKFFLHYLIISLPIPKRLEINLLFKRLRTVVY